MSLLHLYHGDKLQIRHVRRQGSPFSAVLLVNDQTVARAGPDGFIALSTWLRAEADALDRFRQEPEDIHGAENLRGDVPE